MTNTNRTEIENLRAFAVAHNEMEFAHLCTAALHALQGDEREQWAIERIAPAVRTFRAAFLPRDVDIMRINAIRNTDTTRPDGATARKMSAPV